MPPFIPHHALVTSEQSKQTMLVLHGIMGSGGNWRTIAKKLNERCPSWAFALVDLRCHGQSLHAPEPHTLRTASDDLAQLEKQLSLPVRGIMGHSFGGKVSLSYIYSASHPISHAFILDSNPGKLDTPELIHSSDHVLRILESLPQPFPSREYFLQFIIDKGFPAGIAEWLAMNVRRTDDGFQLRLNLKAIRTLLSDYFEQDYWPALQATHTPIQFILGADSNAVSLKDQNRLRALPNILVDVLPNAGHWLHVDNPNGLLDILSNSLNERSL